MASPLASLEAATLSPAERRAVVRLVDELEHALGDGLLAVWLFGSRARGEQPGPESDVDLLVVARERWPTAKRAQHLAYDIAAAEGVDPVSLAVHVWSEEELAHGREVQSFFLAEVDRDKIVLAGSP